MLKKDKKYEKSLKKTKSCARKGHYNTLMVFGGCGVERSGTEGVYGRATVWVERSGTEGVWGNRRCPSKTDWVMGEGGYLIGEFYLNE